MAEKDSGDGPSLELPSFGLRRRKRDEPAAGPAMEAPDPAPEPPRGTVAIEEPEPEPASEPKRRNREKRTRRRPALKPLPAAALTGAVVGGLLVGLMWAGLQTCDFIRGTSSCQGGGVVMWLAILAFVVILGRFLLRWFGLEETGSTSFLAVGLTAVVVLLFSSNLQSSWMALAMPVIGAVAYALSHWVTTAFVEPTGPERHR
ncbi:hypothetical protein GCM10009623_21860 [Nocardioides aestuarii]|uniref:Uncharacterized protein n=1 Tax=Nocardioides aestuarii TaxID=252231 RepID=A0ABW4TN26_9ACTN